MSFLRSAVLYTAILAGANAALADLDAAEAMREGDMKKLVFHSEPMEVSSGTFTDAEGTEYSLADWNGKYVLLNFWATWCAPCRKEMPALDELQTQFKGDRFEVLTVATGRNPLPSIRRFFDEVEIEGLPILLDPTQSFAREMAVLGLPITVLIDPKGREIARMRGDADWASDNAKAIVATLIGSDG
ncbi:MAG: TlpA disulfide reductase family protein [Pseudomonadota bacterium]